MERFTVVCAPDVVLPGRLVERVRFGQRTPVQRAYHAVPAVRVVVAVVAPALCNVDLAAARPLPVDVGVGHHPDGRPEPGALGHLGDHFDLAIFDGSLAFGVDARAADRVDDGAGGLVAADGARVDVQPRMGAGAVCREVHDIVVVHFIKGDVCALRGQGRYDM